MQTTHRRRNRWSEEGNGQVREGTGKHEEEKTHRRNLQAK